MSQKNPVPAGKVQYLKSLSKLTEVAGADLPHNQFSSLGMRKMLTTYERWGKEFADLNTNKITNFRICHN